MKTRITTKGFEEYLEKIAQAGKNIDAISAEALKAGGQILVDGMKRRAPVETHNLQEHVNMKGPIQDGNFHYIEVGIIHDAAFTDAETARYALAQEFGTSSMAAHPYLRPTMDEDMKKARAAMRNVFVEKGAL